MKEIPIYQVDAFASQVFAGNPAAVCPLETWLPGDVLQAIAAENNLSETAFFVKEGEGFDLRWFTPAREVDLCGHATLGSAFVIATYLEPGRDSMRFASRSGPLTVTRRDAWYTLDFPARPPQRRLGETAAVGAALGAEPVEVWQAMYPMAVFEREADVRTLKPDFAAVAKLDGGNIIVTAPGGACDFVSRYFAPGFGIPEDPVTGSAHCVLTPYWAKRLDKTAMEARQISRRGGELHVEDRGERTLISGRVSPYLEGRILV